MTNYYNGYRVHGAEKNISIINFLFVNASLLFYKIIPHTDIAFL